MSVCDAQSECLFDPAGAGLEALLGNSSSAHTAFANWLHGSSRPARSSRSVSSARYPIRAKAMADRSPGTESFWL